MDAPRGRYSVIEKDGRLVVIDNGTGTPIPSSLPPPPARSGRGAPASPGPVAGAGPAALDRAADFLLAIAVREWDSQGRAIVAWRWSESGKPKRWDAALDPRQQRRMGRALLALSLAPLSVLLFTFADDPLIGVFAMAALVLPLWGAISLRRLYGETNDPTLTE
jgi:hypothetical protein